MINELEMINIKNYFIGFRVSEMEYINIQKKAKKAKLNISQYVSLSALDKDIFVFADMKEMNRQLSKIGNNLNQLTMLAHQGKIKEVNLIKMSDDISKMWDKLCELVGRKR
jgi:hypothetical protein